MIALLLWGCTSTPPAEPTPQRVPPPPAKSDAIYFVLVDRFADGTPDAPGTIDKSDPQAFHGGDVQGVLDHLDHIQGMGFGAVWLSPITAMRTEKIDEWGAFHGYWVSDLGAAEPRFGTLEQAKTLSAELKKRDMDLYLDMVFNHVGYDTLLVKQHPDWFHGLGDVKDWNDDVQVRTHDVHGLPDLAQEKPEVYKHLLRQSTHWIREVEPTGFRVDAVRHLGAGFLAGFGNDLKAVAGPDFQLLGEVFEGDPVKLARAHENNKLSSVFDFPLHYAMRDVFCDEAHLGRIASTFAQDRNYRDGALPLVTFLDNHDLPRIGDCDKAPQALAFLLTARGRPSITYGTEIRLKGAEEPANRGDMRFGEKHPMEAEIRTWLGLRASSEAARSGRAIIHELRKDWLLYSRQVDDEGLVVAVNHSAASVGVDLSTLGEVRVEDAWFVDDITHYIRADPKRLAHQVAPGQVRIWRLSGAFAARDDSLSTIEITATGLPAGETPLLVGVGPLGGWDPKSGFGGKWTGVGQAQFTVRRPRGDVLAYKIVVRGPQFLWENRADRYHLIQDSTKLSLTWEH